MQCDPLLAVARRAVVFVVLVLWSWKLCAQAPVITNQPASVTAAATYGASFSVGVSNTTGVSYQWWFDGTSLTGATTSTLTLSSLGYSNGGAYTVVVANGTGAITSAPAVLTVSVPLAVTTVAGLPGAPGSNDGYGPYARFRGPEA